MKPVSISGSPRVNVGKKDAKELRRQGRVPCVLYGGKEQIHFSSLEKDFKKLVYTAEAYLVKIDLDGRHVDAVMQEIQFHKISDKIQHIDFLEIIAGKPIIAHLPVNTVGNPAGVKAGGKLHKKLRTLKVKGMPEALPENMTINIESLEIGDSITVGDLKGKGFEFLDAANVTVVAVKVTRAVVEEEKPAAAVAAAATPGAAAPGAVAAPGAAAKPAAAAPGAAPKKEGKK